MDSGRSFRVSGIRRIARLRDLLGAALLTTTLLGASCATPPPTGLSEDMLGIHFKLDQRSLPNGLKVVMVEDHTIPVVSYQTWFRVGSVDEKPGMTGISHMFEHLMFKGTAKYGPKQFFTELESKGAEVNAYTTRDYTVYYENFVPDLLEKVMDMESDRMANLKLDEEILNSERLVVLEERRLRTDNNPGGRMQEALWELAYKRHPYHWPVIGYPADLLSLTADDLRTYFRSHYQPANAYLVIVGDFDANSAFELIKKYYGPVAAEDRPKRKIPDEPPQTEERRQVMRDQVAGAMFSQAYHVSSADDDDSYALDVLANILFEGTSSRAYRKLVEEKDVALSISGSAYTPTYPGLFTINCAMKQGVPDARAEALLWEVIHELQEKGVTTEEIRTAVKQLTVQVVDGVRTPYGLGQLIGTVATILGDPGRYAEDLGRYLKVTAADVGRVARKYLMPNNRSVVELVPEDPKPKSAPSPEPASGDAATRGGEET